MPDSKRELRVAVDTWPDADLEMRSLDGRTFTGYAAVFNSWSEDLGGFRERIRPGAFAKSLGEQRANIKMFLNHNQDIVLASTRAGTLRLGEDAKGLRVEADLPDTTAGRDLAVSLGRGDVDSMSFGFQTIRDAVPESTKRWDGGPERELVEVRLFEVSPVTGWPAYPATSAAVRTLAEIAGEDEKPLAEALDVLFDKDATLTDEQRDLLIRAINARFPSAPVVTASVADFRQRFAVAHGLS